MVREDARSEARTGLFHWPGPLAVAGPVLPSSHDPESETVYLLPPELAAAWGRAAAEAGTSVSSSLAETAARRKIEAGLAGVAAWEAETGALTDDERAEGEAWARRMLACGADAERASA